MTTPRHSFAVFAALVLIAAGATTSAAQQPQPPRPPTDDRPAEPRPEPSDPMATARRRYPTLFAGAAVTDEQQAGLRFDGAIFGAWDENLLAEFAGPQTTSALQVSGAYTNLMGDLRFNRSTPRVQFMASGGLGVRYYANLNEFAANDFHGGGGASIRLDRTTTLGLHQTLSYAPVYLYGLFADVLPPGIGVVTTPDSSYAVNDDRAVTTDSAVNLEKRFTVRSIATARGGYRRSHFTVVTPRGTDFASVDAGADYRFRFTESADLRVGYFYRNAQFIGAETFGTQIARPVEHNVHLGLAFHPTISEERKTIVTFEGGTAIVNGAVASDVTVTRRQVRLVGDAAIAHQMGRTWLAVAGFKRGTGFVQGLNGPVFTDAVSATLTGFFNERTDLYLSAGYSNGEPTLVGAVQQFSTTTAEAKLRVAINPRWAVTSQYVFYRYDFTDIVSLAAGLEPRVSRNTFRIGLNVAWPLR